MSGDGLASATRFLVLALSVLYALAAVVGLALIDFDTTRSVVLIAVAAVMACSIALARHRAAPA
jgi:hypothetical protein